MTLTDRQKHWQRQRHMLHMAAVLASGSRDTTVTAPGLPLDAFTDVLPIAAWGTFAWNTAAKSSPLFVTDDGSAADVSADATTGMATGTFTGQRISRFYPQVGTAYPAQSTLASRPIVTAAVREAYPEVKWHYRLGTLNTNKTMPVTSGFSRTGRDLTRVWIARPSPETYAASGIANGYSGVNVQFKLINASAFGPVYTPDASITYMSRTFNGTGGFVDTNNMIPNLAPVVFALRMNATDMTMWVDGRKYTLTGAPTATSVTLSEIGTFSPASSQTNQCTYMGEAWFPELTDAQVSALTLKIQGYLAGVAVTAKTALWMFDGDSIIAGYSNADGNRDVRDLSWPYLLLSSLTATQRSKIIAANMGHSSAHLGTTASAEHNLTTFQANKINAHITSGSGYTNRVVVFSGAGNDIVYGGTDAAIRTALTTYYNAAITAGATRCLICTQPPRQGLTAPQETSRLTLNANILTDFGANAVDVAAQTWQPLGAADWTSCYQDGIHPNAAGRQLFVNAIKTTMEALI